MRSLGYYLGLDTTPEYDEYQRGCIGLLNLRLGLLDRNLRNPLQDAKACFKDFESAYQYAKNLPTEKGKAVRIFGVLSNTLSISEAERNGLKGKVSTEAFPWTPGNLQDYCTLHQITDDRATWFWESMSESCGRYRGDLRSTDPRTRAHPRMPNARHRPFTSVMPENVEKQTDHKYSLFCVVYATSSRNPYLPPAKTYGASGR
jgi:hypothetical protein